MALEYCQAKKDDVAVDRYTVNAITLSPLINVQGGIDCLSELKLVNCKTFVRFFSITSLNNQTNMTVLAVKVMKGHIQQMEMGRNLTEMVLSAEYNM